MWLSIEIHCGISLFRITNFAGGPRLEDKQLFSGQHQQRETGQRFCLTLRCHYPIAANCECQFVLSSPPNSLPLLLEMALMRVEWINTTVERKAKTLN